MAHGVSAVGFSTFELDSVMGVLKAYTTRVGEGPYPTEETDLEKAEALREKGNEYGATTGRPRKVGWLDLPALRYAKIRSGLTEFVITKADVLNGMDEIKICTAYDVNGKIKDIPSSSYDFFVAKPVYETLKGWPNTQHINFLKYMTFIEEKTGIKINYISYGPKTEEMMGKNKMIGLI
jgi:adenylosuccinate synthase